ncbi:mitochondrial uncoupling protein 4C-like [Drosophila innubila]|uniref:mitochondrial uncoupling protein 4C-like n=1 Tax=Drosophila innubila TaxID=198719 RepID=UPI00148CE090|nr:mitochondrial uncoupling protein 4C-like [Drosophila innubila]
MDKDENNYWHMRTPYDTTLVPKLRNSQEQISMGNLFQLYTNAFIGANIAEASVLALDATKATVHAGISALILRNFMFHSLRVTLYDVLRRRIIYIDAENQEMINFPSTLMSGSAAGCIAQALFNPFDMIRVKIEENKTSSLMSVLKSIHRNSVIWRNVGYRCPHACLLTAGDVAAYDLSKRNFKKYLQLKEQLPLHFASALVAGLVASLLSHPADVIKFRLLNQPTDKKGIGLYYRRSLECLVKLMREEGVFSLYKGLLPCWLRLGSWSVLFWLSVEQFQLWEGQTGF